MAGSRSSPTVDSDAQELINRYNLADLVARVEEVLFNQQATPIRVVRMILSADREWSEDRPRVLVTVEFDSTLTDAYEAWKQVSPQVRSFTDTEERAETVSFQFAGRE